jgi:hypothetical protein
VGSWSHDPLEEVLEDVFIKGAVEAEGRADGPLADLPGDPEFPLGLADDLRGGCSYALVPLDDDRGGDAR